MYKVTKELELRERVRRVKEMLRLSMDGITAQRLRGLGYKLVFGVTYPRLKELAEKIQPDSDLAMNLWNLHQRETMILATILMEEPIDEERVSFLIKDAFNEEIAEYLCRNLLTRLENPWKIIESNKEGDYFEYIKYSLASRLLLEGKDNAIVSKLIEESPEVTQRLNERQISSVASLLKRAYKEHKDEVSSVLKTLESSEDIKSKWVAEELATYIEFC